MANSHRTIRGQAGWSATLVALAVFMAGTVPSARAVGGGDDPGDAPAPGGGFESFAPGDTSTFVDQQGQPVLRVSDGHDLDQYLYRSSGPLDFAIDIDGDFGPVEMDGSPAEGNLLFGKDLKLTLRVYDVDDDYTGTDVEEEVDQLVVNGVNTLEALSGADGQWSVNTFTISSDLLVLPTEGNSPVQNDFQILIDTANSGADVWAVEVDWAELRLFDNVAQPVALLHGLNDSPGTMSPMGNYFEAQHTALQDRIIRPALNAVGSTEVNAEILVDLIADLAEEGQVPRVDMVGYSKGGLDARRYVFNNPGVVDNLVMVGTPNGGALLADVACGLMRLPLSIPHVIALRLLASEFAGPCRGPQDAAYQLTTGYVQDTFNKQVLDRPSTQYFTAAGNLTWFFRGPTDGVVSVDSVEWLSGSGGGDPTVPRLHRSIGHFPRHHLDLVEDQSPVLPHTLCVIYLRFCPNIEATETSELSILENGGVEVRAMPDEVEVPANDDVNVQLDFEGSSVASVMLFFEDLADIEATLDGDPLEVVDFFGGEVLVVTADPTDAGVLHVENDSSNPAEGAALVAVESDRVLTVASSTGLAAPSESVDITIEVSEVDSGDAPVLVILDSDGDEVDEFTPSSIGTGVWEESLDPLPGGTYTASVFLDGDRPRMASAIFTVSAGAAELDGGFAESTVDDDGDSLFDALVISPEVEVATAGVYHVALSLEDGSGNLVAASGGVANLGTGSQVIPVRVEGADLFTSRTSGPYEVVDVVLSREDGDAVILEHELASLGATDSYDFDEFEHFPVHFDLDGFSDDLVDTNSDEEPDEIQVDGSVWVDSAGTYAINARLLTDDGTELVEFQTTTSLTVGDNGFQLVFPWDTVQAGGVDGPYTVADLSVYPSSSADVLGYLPVAHYTAAYEVAQPVSYSYDFSGADEDPWESGWSFLPSNPSELPYLYDDTGEFYSDSGDLVAALRPETMSDITQQIQVVWNSQIRRSWGLIVRGDDTASNGYLCVLANDAGTFPSLYPELTIWRSSGGWWTPIASTGSLSISSDQELKCEASGSTVRAKLWPSGTSEPGSWDLSATDTAFATGKAGIFLSGSGNRYLNVDDYSLEGYESTPIGPPDPGGGSWFTEPFDEDPGDPWPTGWTHLSSNPSEPDPVVYDSAGFLEADDHYVLSHRANSYGDSEQIVRVIWNDRSDSYWSLVSRFSTTEFDGYECALFSLQAVNSGTPTLAIARNDDGIETVLDDTTVTPGTDQWLKCVTEGTDIKAKVWDVGTTEPTGWDLEVTDSAYTTGVVGVALGGDQTVGVDDYRLGPS